MVFASLGYSKNSTTCLVLSWNWMNEWMHLWMNEERMSSIKMLIKWSILVWTAVIKHYNLCGLNNIYFLGSRAWEVQNQVTRTFSVWWEPPSWFADGYLFAVSSHGGESKRTVSFVSSYKVTNIIMGALPSLPHLNLIASKVPPANTRTLGIRALTYEFWRNATIQSIVKSLKNK